MYLTGDLGYVGKDGFVRYIGRSDFQVKINGFRIELDEIDKVLISHKDIKDCVSVIKEFNNKKHIVTYYSSNTDINTSNILSYLKSKLPAYMIPTKLVKLDVLPLNHNGKVDKKALPSVNLTDTDEEFILPSTENEIKLANIWKDLFNIQKISTNFNFFDIGGDSLLSIKLCAKILQVFNVNVTIKDVFSNPTFSDMILLIQNSDKHSISDKIQRVNEAEYYPLSSAQKRVYYSLSFAGNDSILYNLPGGIILNKIPDISKLEKAFQELINKHEAFRTYFEVIDR